MYSHNHKRSHFSSVQNRNVKIAGLIALLLICRHFLGRPSRSRRFPRNKNVSSPSTCESQYCGEPLDREVACSASDRQGSNFESCVWRTVSSHSSHHPQEVLLAQFSLYVHKGGLKPDSFYIISTTSTQQCGSITIIVHLDIKGCICPLCKVTDTPFLFQGDAFFIALLMLYNVCKKDASSQSYYVEV